MKPRRASSTTLCLETFRIQQSTTHTQVLSCIPETQHWPDELAGAGQMPSHESRLGQMPQQWLWGGWLSELSVEVQVQPSDGHSLEKNTNHDESTKVQSLGKQKIITCIVEYWQGSLEVSEHANSLQLAEGEQVLDNHTTYTKYCSLKLK